MVLEKKASPRGTPTWVGVNAFPYTVGEIFKHDSREHVVGNVFWQATQRNYSLFADLASVRGHGREPLGLPDDASDLALMMADSWGEDGHSHTWITMDEALPIFLQAGQFGSMSEAVTTALAKGDIEGTLMRYMAHFWSLDSESESLADYRLIIWFDN
jgi:hypothetical protein